MRVLVFALLVACNDCNTPPPQPRVYGDDASDDCVRACAKLSAWACPEAQPTPAGESCESFCMHESAMLNAVCVEGAASPGDLARCGVRCQR